MYKVEFDSDTDGNWCSQCASQLYATREEAQAAIDADETAGPDAYGNTCTVEIVWVGETCEEDVLEAVHAIGRGEAPLVMAPVEREISYLREAIATETDARVRARMQGRLDDVLSGRDHLREEPS